MRKFMSITVVALVAVILLAGCGTKYVDGTWEGTSPADSRGAYGHVVLRIQDGKIVSADFQEVMANGTAKTMETYANWPQAIEAIEALPGKLVETQDIDKVDNIAEATGTVDKFKDAVRSALVNSRGEAQHSMKDGVYSYMDDSSERNVYEGTIAVHAGQIIAVHYAEMSKSTMIPKHLPEAEYGWEEAVKFLSEAPGQLIETQDPEAVDFIAEATGSYDKFVEIMKLLIAEAKK